jgi:hypothetical protein
MDAQLKELIELQREQNQLLKKYLWRFRFSLLTLLLLTTATCCCLGFMIYRQQRGGSLSTASAPVLPSPAGTYTATPVWLGPPRTRAGTTLNTDRYVDPAPGQ